MKSPNALAASAADDWELANLPLTISSPPAARYASMIASFGR
jgi:hypothetical protein